MRKGIIIQNINMHALIMIFILLAMKGRVLNKNIRRVPEYLQNVWIVQNHKNDTQAIKEMLNSKVDYSVLQELKQASSLVEAPNIDKKPNKKKLMQMFKKVKDIKERNSIIVQAYKKGYSQQMIAKVLIITQQAVFAMIKRSRG